MTDRHTISPDVGPGTEPAALSAGTQLHLAREDAGLTLDAVAQQLKLAPRQVQAIEDDDFKGLPGRTFVRGFVRNYARLLHLDAEAVLAALPGGSTSSLDSPALHATAPTMGELPASERGRSSWTRWAIPLTLVAVIAAAAVYEFSRGRDERGLRDDTAASGSADYSAMTAPATGEHAAKLGVPVSPPSSQSTHQPLVNPLATKETPADGGQAAAGGAAASSVAAPAADDAAAEATLLLSFHDKSWTEVRERSGRVLLSQLMAPGQTQTFSASPPYDLVIGNATEVTVTYRGQPVDLAPFIRSGVARLTLR